MSSDPPQGQLNQDTRIWRYLDLPKFLDLLSRRALYFARLDRLGDPFEGAVPRQFIIDRYRKDFGITLSANEAEDKEYIRRTRKLIQRNVYANCWNSSDHESEALWRLYSREGIAVRSTVGRLHYSLGKFEGFGIPIARVNYRGPGDTTFISNLEESMINAALTKRKSFEHEHEIRAYFMLPAPSKIENGLTVPDIDNPDLAPGHHIPVNIDLLIEHVFISPGRPEWFRQLVKELMKRFDLPDVPVERSVLDESPDLF